jgi:hypothetical protein
MRAELDKHGRLLLMPETSTEVHAMHHWSAQNIVQMRDEKLNEDAFVRGSAILICSADSPPREVAHG